MKIHKDSAGCLILTTPRPARRVIFRFQLPDEGGVYLVPAVAPCTHRMDPARMATLRRCVREAGPDKYMLLVTLDNGDNLAVDGYDLARIL
jgi:hypothetical protein